MSSFWLKMIGTAENRCPNPYLLEYVDFTREPRDLRVGDWLVLYAVGWRTRVFATARVTSEPYPSGVERFPIRVNIEYLVNRFVPSGVRLREILDSDRDLIPAIQWGHTYLPLRQEEFDRAAAALQEASVTA